MDIHEWGPHSWMVAVTGGSCYPSRGGKSTGRMKNPRVGWANNIEKGDEGYLKGRNKRVMWIKSMDRISIHGRGENSTSSVQQIQHLRVNYVFVFCLFVRWKYILFPFLIFVFLIFCFFLPSPIHGSGLPHSWIFYFEISHKIKCTLQNPAWYLESMTSAEVRAANNVYFQLGAMCSDRKPQRQCNPFLSYL